MSQSVLLKAKGLYSYPNNLSEVPEGALLQASNVFINRDSIVETRRGFKLYGDDMGSGSATTAHQLLNYKGRILRHFGAGAGTTLDWDDSTGTFTSFSGTYSEVEEGLRIKGLEVNGNFYFTTSNGIQKISVANATDLGATSITNAGGVKALDLSARLDPTPGWFTQESVVAYRLVWGIKDANSNLILGSPSERVVIYNPLTDLLITDFNHLLVLLDTVSTPGGISDQNYVSTLKLAMFSDPSTVKTNLIALSAKLDADTVITSGAIDTASASLTSNVASLVFNSSVATFLAIGDEIVISGLTGAGTTADLNGTHTLTGVSGTTVTFNFTHGNFVSTPDTGGVVKRLKYTLITEPGDPSIPATSTELLALQAYYDEIVSDLQGELTGIVPTPAIFDNSTSTQSSTVDLTFSIPQDITTAYFYQIYRTAMTTSSGPVNLFDLDPGDEQALVYEANPTSGDISAGVITVTDIVPESFRGANLYTNPATGEGIAQANEVPPLAKDITTYKGYTFYFNTSTKERLNLSLLSVSELTSGVSTVTITDGTTTNTYTFVSPAAKSTKVTCTTFGAVGGAGKYFTLSNANNLTNYYVWYNVNSGNTDPAPSNRTGIEVDVLSTDTASQVATKTKNAINQVNDFTASVSTTDVTITNSAKGISTNAANVTTSFTFVILVQGAGEDAANKKVLLSDADTPAQQVDETARSLERVINRDASEIVYVFYLSGPDDVPGMLLFESRDLGASAFHLLADSVDTGGQFSPAIPVVGSSTISTNEVAPNRVYYSKYQQPEAVPILNYIDVGAKDKQIFRGLALRSSLFILKEESIFRLSGFSPPFTVELSDSSALILCPDSAVILNNLIYMISTQGITTVGDTGVGVISRPIENFLNKLNVSRYPSFTSATFGIGYESDRSYYFYTVMDTSDDFATICFRYNTFTNTWTTADVSKRCGIINDFDDRMYVGPTDTNFIEQERKSFTRIDYADREYLITIDEGALIGDKLTLTSVANINEGDVVVQIQYLTISQYNRLLTKLDGDLSVADSDYFSTLGASNGANLRSSLDNLAAKLDLDTGIADTDYTSSISGYGTSLQDEQDAFNVIINKLNLDTGVFYSNYKLSSGTVSKEVKITAVDTLNKVITLRYAYPFTVGNASTYASIPSEITWVPQYMGDTSMSKQISEGTLIFEANTFSEASISYATDLSPSFEIINFNGAGNGIFGSVPFGTTNFGGAGNGIPLRTLIPREKQRCRYIKPKFSHASSRELFSLYGLSLTFQPVSQRAYR